MKKKNHFTKHMHKRLDVMTYFMTHTKAETAKRFELTAGELNSLLCVAYTKPEFKHLRKDKRTHAEWGAKDYRTMLTHAGLVRMETVSKLLKRGKSGVDRRFVKLKVHSRVINGMTLTQFRKIFACEPKFSLKTKSGANPQVAPRFVPWVYLANEIDCKRLRAYGPIEKYVDAMAMFQEWVYQGDALNKMTRILDDASQS